MCSTVEKGVELTKNGRHEDMTMETFSLSSVVAVSASVRKRNRGKKAREEKQGRREGKEVEGNKREQGKGEGVESMEEEGHKVATATRAH